MWNHRVGYILALYICYFYKRQWRWKLHLENVPHFSDLCQILGMKTWWNNLSKQYKSWYTKYLLTVLFFFFFLSVSESFIKSEHIPPCSLGCVQNPGNRSHDLCEWFLCGHATDSLRALTSKQSAVFEFMGSQSGASRISCKSSQSQTFTLNLQITFSK